MLNLGLLGGWPAGGPLQDTGMPALDPSIVSGAPLSADGAPLVDAFRDLVDALAAPSTPVAPPTAIESAASEDHLPSCARAEETDDARDENTQVMCDGAIPVTDPWLLAPLPPPVAVDTSVPSGSGLPASDPSTPSVRARLDPIADSEGRDVNEGRDGRDGLEVHEGRDGREVREPARPPVGTRPEPVRPDAPPALAPLSSAIVDGSPVSPNDIPPASVFEIAEETQDVDARDSRPVMPGSQPAEAQAIGPGAGFDRRDGHHESSSHRPLAYTAPTRRAPVSSDQNPFVVPAASVLMPGVRVGPYASVAGAGPASPSDRTVPEIVQTIRLMWTRGIGEAQIQLDPQQFGELTLVLKVEGREVAARLQAATPEVRDWLRANQHVLREGLASHDLRLDRLDIASSAEERRDGSSRDAREHSNDDSRGSRRPPKKRNAGAVFDVVA